MSVQMLGMMRERGHRVAALLARACEPELLRATDGAADERALAAFAGPADVRSVAAIAGAVRGFHPDILFATTPDEWVWTCLLPRPLRKASLVLARHMSLALPPAVRWLANRRAEAVIAVSEAVRSSLTARPGISPERIHVIPNPVRFRSRDGAPSPQERARLRRSMGLDGEGRWVGFFGGDNALKGIGDVMDAAARIRGNGTDLRLLVCGRVRDRESIVKLAAPAHLENYVHCAPDADIEKALGAVEVVAMPTHSCLGEGMPLTALEAMACGTPVAAYAVAGIIDALGEGGDACGVLVKADDPCDLAEGLARLLANPEEAARIAQRGLIRVRKNHLPEDAADRYERVFRELADHGEAVR